MRRRRCAPVVVASDSEEDEEPCGGASPAATPCGDGDASSCTCSGSPAWDDRLTMSVLRRVEAAEEGAAASLSRSLSSVAGRWAQGLQDVALPDFDRPGGTPSGTPDTAFAKTYLSRNAPPCGGGSPLDASSLSSSSPRRRRRGAASTASDLDARVAALLNDTPSEASPPSSPRPVAPSAPASPQDGGAAAPASPVKTASLSASPGSPPGASASEQVGGTAPASPAKAASRSASPSDGGDILDQLARRYLDGEGGQEAEAATPAANSPPAPSPPPPAPPREAAVDVAGQSFLAWKRGGGSPQEYLEAVQAAEAEGARQGRARKEPKEKKAAAKAKAKKAKASSAVATAPAAKRQKQNAAPPPPSKRSKRTKGAALAPLNPNSSAASRWTGKRGGGRAGQALRKLAKAAFQDERADAGFDPEKELQLLEGEAGPGRAVWADTKLALAFGADAALQDFGDMAAAYEEPRLHGMTRMERAVKTRLELDAQAGAVEDFEDASG